jgi:hypothetical protein
MDRHERVERILGRWCAGERLVRRPMAADWERDYAVAIAVALAALQGYRTAEALLAADEAHALDEAWLGRVCRLPSGRLLNVDLVHQAAYWRRLQELLAEQAGNA